MPHRKKLLGELAETTALRSNLKMNLFTLALAAFAYSDLSFGATTKPEIFQVETRFSDGKSVQETITRLSLEPGCFAGDKAQNLNQSFEVKSLTVKNTSTAGELSVKKSNLNLKTVSPKMSSFIWDITTMTRPCFVMATNPTNCQHQERSPSEWTATISRKICRT